MARNSLAVPHELYDGALVLWLLPYSSYRTGMVMNRFAEIVPQHEEPDEQGKPRMVWDNTGNVFVLLEGHLLDLEVKDDQRLEVRMWGAYWSARNGDLAHNWEEFQTVNTRRMNDDFIDAYNATRDTSYAASPDLKQPPEGADPNASSATKKPKGGS